MTGIEVQQVEDVGVVEDEVALEARAEARADLLRGSPERRSLVDVDVVKSNTGIEFRGYAAVFGTPYEVEDRFGKFTETVERRAFERALNANPDVVLNVNHGGLPLARTKSGTLELRTDNRGLEVRASLEPRDPDVQRVMYKIERGDMGDMSFTFRAVRDSWNYGHTERTLHEVAVDGGDVTITEKGFNPATEAQIRSAVASLNEDFDDMLLEARSAKFDITELRSAHQNLGRLLNELSPRKTFSVKQAEMEILLTTR